MPRLPHSLLLKAYNISPLLPLVLQGTRSLPSAVNELRWLREHVLKTNKPTPTTQKELLRLCKRRAHSEPLQYILGSQPFGELDIKCRPGVLIARPEPEAYTTYLAKLLLKGSKGDRGFEFDERKPLRILDLCTGTGCISLLLYSLLVKRFPGVQINGWDISPNAVSLAVENLKTNISKGHLKIHPSQKPPPIQFDQVDIFSRFNRGQKKQLHCDIIVCNPPYISQKAFTQDTGRSVRKWEPRLALVPEVEVEGYDGVKAEDVFYRRLIDLHTRFARSKLLVMEVGGDAQALRVAGMALQDELPSRRDTVEIWRDWPESKNGLEGNGRVVVGGRVVGVKGMGHMRAVVVKSPDYVWSKDGAGLASR
ncbi:putative mitochondrial N(5)-glutamine methyltransferase [Lachnellula hyalina]|uniref:peptide chain release factor N(5)-glutamine methyltransferase n=1 Tax=Lachnellula hyalina TaxID=1316788 RepID=A0A8H8U1J3_9HELO|nr:putative mitochondrial N(5)-glutamine methyltransferase [Lachnellula hyalina]TVY27086.1 putative mitochondrial N(5)-glutamine methyltransferase [Lachnellula hyalina]